MNERVKRVFSRIGDDPQLKIKRKIARKMTRSEELTVARLLFQVWKDWRRERKALDSQR